MNKKLGVIFVYLIFIIFPPVNNILEIDLKKITLYKGNYSEFKKEKTLRLEQHRAAYKNQQKQIKELIILEKR